jgi:hypothetical protein
MFTYSDLSYEEDNVMQLTTNVNYEYVDMFDIDMNINDFISETSHLLEDIDLGHTPIPEPNADEDVLDRNALQPIPAVDDTQRRVGLDNPVAAMAIRLAETAALNKFGSNLEDPNPVKRAIANGAYNLGIDAAATTTNAASNSIGAATRGLF